MRRDSLVACEDRSSPASLQQPLPRTAAQHRIGNRLLNALAQSHRARRYTAKSGGQPGLEPGLDLTGENWRRPLGTDGDDHRIAVDDRRHDEGAFARCINHVERDVRPAHRLGDLFIRVLRVVRRKDHGRPLQVGGFETAPLQYERTLLAQCLDIATDICGDHPDARRRLGEQAQLLQRFLTAARDQDVATLQVDENWEVPQGCDLSLRRAIIERLCPPPNTRSVATNLSGWSYRGMK
jgi:hypothetical protein